MRVSFSQKKKLNDLIIKDRELVLIHTNTGLLILIN